MRKSFIKLYFVSTILLILIITFLGSAYFFQDSTDIFLQLGITPEIVTEYLPIVGRIWIGNLGLSSFLAVTSYAIEEEMNFTSKTALYAFLANIIYAVILIVILRKMLRKKPMSLMGGF